jgi:hypothetical protein
MKTITSPNSINMDSNVPNKDEMDEPPSQCFRLSASHSITAAGLEVLVELHYEVLLFSLKAWQSKKSPGDLVFEPDLLSEFVSDLRARAERDELSLTALSGPALLVELKAYLGIDDNITC